MTPTALSVYINWLQDQLDAKKWGKVSLSFTICNGQVTDVVMESSSSEHFAMVKN